VAYTDPASYAVRAVQGLWTEMGGAVAGNVHYGEVPAALQAQKPAFEVSSPTLPDIIRDINKFSNNVMAQQVFLTLGRVSGKLSESDASADSALALAPAPAPLSSFAAARTSVQRWWKERISADDVPVLDNGSGLSRNERITANGLGRLLQVAYRSPWMPELMSSLPISGMDGTLRRVKSKALGSAHLKTGSLSNVIAIAGYVHPANGKPQILVALINHPNANAARPALDALVEWATREPTGNR
jgi:D-alanyl-D-alanine carboxypeptidase/D-alanyl-D-alanine-endopeptidase (penicillin-binding protein 4)